MKKLAKLTKKYLPDGLILLGILIFSYNYFRPETFISFCFGSDSYCTYTHTSGKVLGIMLIAVGAVVATRRYRDNMKY